MKKMSLEEGIRYLGDVSNAMPPVLEKKMKLVCAKLTGDIQESMSKTERDESRSYFTSNKKIPHHPSKPGCPPAPDTGTLRNSIRYRVENRGNEVYGVVGTTQLDPPYGAYLENGTSRMKPRPWLAPAVESNKDFIQKTFESGLKEAFGCR
ncbi:MAG: hypothetical protein II837_03940 [Treponema sp.]|nr:hypothetical protein [Treponema sp.]